MVDMKIYTYLYVVWMLCINPLTPKIWLLILPSGCKHISLWISFENLLLDHDINFYLISLSILITCSLDNVRPLKGVVTCWSLLGVKGFKYCKVLVEYL